MVGKYPDKFVKAVRAEYPDWKELHRALDRGSEIVGRYLDDESSGSISPEDIVKLIKKGRIQELKEKAMQMTRRRKLYSMWSELQRAVAD